MSESGIKDPTLFKAIASNFNQRKFEKQKYTDAIRKLDQEAAGHAPFLMKVVPPEVSEWVKSKEILHHLFTEGQFGTVVIFEKFGFKDEPDFTRKMDSLQEVWSENVTIKVKPANSKTCFVSITALE